MSLQSDLIGLGMTWEQSVLLGGETVNDSPTRSASTGLTAAGTTLANGLVLTSFINIVSTAAASTGVVLPSNWPVGQIGFVQNNGANIINLWPHSSSGTINGGTAGAAVTIAISAGDLVMRNSATDWGVYVMAKEA